MSTVLNLGRLLSDTARLYPEREALVQGSLRRTWREVDDRVNAAVAGLRALGIAKGDRLLVVAANCPALFEHMWVAFKLGAVWVPCNFRLVPREIAYIAENAGARAVFYGSGYEAHVDAARAGAPGVKHVLAFGAPRAGEIGYEALIASNAGAAVGEEPVAYDDPLWLFYTSGTTGRSKGAELTHGQMGYVVTNMLADLMPGLAADDASLVVAPLSHGAGAHVPPQVARGAKTVLLASPKFDPDEVWRLVEQHRITNMFTVPTIVKMLIEHPAADRYDHSSLRHVIYAGAPMYRADQKIALAKLGPVLVQYYGMGEVTGCITYLPPHLHTADDASPLARVGSCGIPRTGMEVAIFDLDGKPRAPGEQGEICVRGLGVFKGYFGNPEANAKSFRDGWFRTGDLGRVDEAGYVYITGRASDMYISGGANVYPREVEEVLLTHPAVSEVAVLGVPDPKWGEAGVAVVVRHRRAAADAADLARFLDDKLARYKHPRRIFFWDEIPKSGYGKVPKYLIRAQLYERGDLREGEAV
ncbi:MAG: AMP-binding protein [Alphaproteobacteria bacterium]|nr:AMP-binding protein [Alphaproteobacteria bacterium]